jgi:hypothetical protein
MCVQFDGLLKGHPDWRRKTLLHRAGPEHQDVDTGIGLAVIAKRAGDLPRRMFGVPGFHPRPDALLQ